MRYAQQTWRALLGAWMWVFIAGQGFAQSTNTDVVALSDVVVTATRSGTPRLELPFSLASVSGEEIRLSKMPRTMPEALREIPAVMVQKTGHAQGSPFIRGFTGFRTLFLVDGVRLNNSVFREGPNQYWGTVDPLVMDRLEVVKGPSSVLYGSDAVGGTVNALTASPLTEENGGRLYYRYATAEDAHIGRVQGVRAGSTSAVRAGVNAKSFGNLESGGGKLPETGYDELDFDARADQILSDHAILTVAHQTVDQDDAWRTHATVFAVPFRGTSVGSDKERSLDQNRHLTYARVDAADLPGFAENIQATVSHHRQGEEQFRIKGDGSRDLQGFEVDTFGASLQAQSPTDAGTWIYGVELYRDLVESSRDKLNADNSVKSSSIQGPVGDDATYDTLGAYVQDQVEVADRLDMIIGGRFSNFAAEVDKFENPNTGESDSLDQDFDALAGSLRFVYELLQDAGLNAYAGVSQGFRAPNLSDLTRLDTARSNEIETPSPDLDPERFDAYEIGLVGGDAKAGAECAYYYTDIEDLIVRTPTGEVIDGSDEVTKKNAGSGYVHGIELGGHVRPVEIVKVWGNLTWMDGEVDSFPTSSPEKVREPFSRLMPLTANAGIKYEPGPAWWVEGLVTTAEKQDDLATSDVRDTERIPPGGTPGFTVFGIRGGRKVRENVNLSAAVENIADENYRVHGSGLNEPGRNFVIAADVAF